MRDLHRELLLLHRRVRIVRSKIPGSADSATSIVLPILATETGLTAGELCTRLHVGAPKMSRLVASLESRRLIERDRVEDDGRAKQLRITGTGRLALERVIDEDNRIVDLTLHVLSATDRVRLARFFDFLSDALGAARDIRGLGEGVGVAEQKRAGRALGMIGDDYLGSGIDIFRYQICFTLLDSSQPPRFRDIRRALSFDPSMISRELDRLVQERWCTKETPGSDARGIVVRWTAEGFEGFTRTHEQATAHLRDALSTFPVGEVREILDIIRRVNESTIPRSSVRKLRIHACRTTQQRFQARAWAVEWLVSKGEHLRLPAILVPDEGSCYVVHRDDAPIGIVTVESPRKDRTEIRRFDTAPGAPIDADQLETVLIAVSSAEGARRIGFSREVGHRLSSELARLHTKTSGGVIVWTPEGH